MKDVTEIYHIYTISLATTHAVKLTYVATLMIIVIIAYALTLAALKRNPGL